MGYTLMAVVAGALGVAGAGAAGGADLSAGARPEMEQVRRATVKYHDVAKAMADGYHRVSPCVDGRPTFDGAMGVHYLDHDLLVDPAVDPTRPEVLVYFPVDGDKLRLVAVEWMTVDGDQDVDTDGDRPTLFGEPFHGPMQGHAPGEPVHYDLHAWVWQSNPAGLFEDWNPSLTCPEE